MFEKQLGDTMEVFMDDMLVKSLDRTDHLNYLAKCFATLRKYQMKLNPAKCSFEVASWTFLGYIMTQKGIEVNPKQIKTIQDLPSPTNVKQV